MDHIDLYKINTKRREEGKKELSMSEARRLEAQRPAGTSIWDFLTIFNISALSSSPSNSSSHSSSCDSNSSSDSSGSSGSWGGSDSGSSGGGDCGGGGGF
jgi:hypothetical protein